ncbi:MAG: PQ-loop repeat-containing protein [Thermodesulfobacteriota bacterium]
MEIENIFELMGTTGSLILCVSAVPQILKTYRLKCADGLSGLYLLVLVIGMALIQLYAIHIKDAVFIWGNGISLLLTSILLGLRCQYGKKAG